MRTNEFMAFGNIPLFGTYAADTGRDIGGYSGGERDVDNSAAGDCQAEPAVGHVIGEAVSIDSVGSFTTNPPVQRNEDKRPTGDGGDGGGNRQSY